MEKSWILELQCSRVSGVVDWNANSREEGISFPRVCLDVNKIFGQVATSESVGWITKKFPLQWLKVRIRFIPRSVSIYSLRFFHKAVSSCSERWTVKWEYWNSIPTERACYTLDHWTAEKVWNFIFVTASLFIYFSSTIKNRCVLRVRVSISPHLITVPKTLK